MTHDSDQPATDPLGAAKIQTLEDLAGLLRALRRRHARASRDSALTYRELAARTGWSQTAIAEYFTAKTLPPTDRFDALARLLGASPAEQGALASTRDRVEEHRRDSRQAAQAPAPSTSPLPGPVPSARQKPRPAGRGSSRRVVPRQLPAAARQFVGRATELTTLTGLLDRPSAAGTVVVSAIGGTAGIGKTTLALHWAHQVANRFPDGQLYVNLRGFDPGGVPVSPAEALRGFLDAFEIPPQQIPANLDAQAAMFRSRLADQRVLVVLDNARDAGQVRPLLPGSPTCLVVVTSRNQLSGLVAAEGALPITLDLPTHAEARDLLARHLGPDRVMAEPEATHEIITCCARLPLALAIVAARAATHSRFPLHTLAAELRDSHDRLNAFIGADPTADVRAVFSWSYRALSPAAAQLFRRLGLHPGPDTSIAAVASLAGVPSPEVRPLLAELTHAHLIEEQTPGRYTFHDLLRAYATEQAHHSDPDHERQAATHRVLDHYLHTAYTADRLLSPTRDPITPDPPQPGVTPESLAGYGQALTWLTAEHPVLVAAVNHAADTGFDTHTWQLAWTLRTYVDRRGHWHDWVATQHAALAATRRLADPAAQARTHRLLASAYTSMSRLDDAHSHLREALDLSIQTSDHTGQAHAHYSLAMTRERQGRHTEAIDHARKALDLYAASGERVWQADALNVFGWNQALVGDYSQALILCEQALALYQELNISYGKAATWDSLGYVHHHLGHHHKAIACYRRSLKLFRDLGDRYYEANTLSHLGDTYHAAGAVEAACDAYEQALSILNDLDHPDAGQVLSRLAATNQPAIPAPAPANHAAGQA